jgi:hypothetical protein
MTHPDYPTVSYGHAGLALTKGVAVSGDGTLCEDRQYAEEAGRRDRVEVVLVPHRDPVQPPFWLVKNGVPRAPID